MCVCVCFVYQIWHWKRNFKELLFRLNWSSGSCDVQFHAIHSVWLRNGKRNFWFVEQEQKRWKKKIRSQVIRGMIVAFAWHVNREWEARKSSFRKLTWDHMKVGVNKASSIVISRRLFCGAKHIFCGRIRKLNTPDIRCLLLCLQYQTRNQFVVAAANEIEK